MKNIFILFGLFHSVVIKSQDSLYCYNSGGALTQREIITEEMSNKPLLENSLILMPYVMKEKDVLHIMAAKNNSEVNHLLLKMNRANNIKPIGFAAIPFGLLGALSFSGIKNMYGEGGSSLKIHQGFGAGLVALSAMCLSASCYFKMQRTKNYKKAIANYNRLYN